MPMTADEALTALRECAYYDGLGVTSAGLAEDAEAAEAAIREAFATDDRARAELARLEAKVDGSIGVTRVIAELQRDMLKRIIGGEGS